MLTVTLQYERTYAVVDDRSRRQLEVLEADDLDQGLLEYLNGDGAIGGLSASSVQSKFARTTTTTGEDGTYIVVAISCSAMRKKYVPSVSTFCSF